MSVETIIDVLNSELSAFGVEQRMSYGGVVGALELRVSSPLTEPQKETVRALVQEQLRAKGLPLIAEPLRLKSFAGVAAS